MSSDSNSVEDKAEDKVEENEEEDMSKRKKLKISNDVEEQVDSNKNEETKAEISESSKGTPENTDLPVNSEDSSTNNSDVVVSNVDNSTNNSDNTSNESEQVESASSSNVCNSASSETECTDSNADAPKQSVDNDSTEAEQSDSNTDAQKQSSDNDVAQTEQSDSSTDVPKQSSDDTTQAEQSESNTVTPKQSLDNDTPQTEQSDSKANAPKQSSDDNDKTEVEQSVSVTQDDNQASKSDPPVDKAGQESESPDGSTDLVSDNEKVTTTQADADNKNEESKTFPNSLKNDQESLYELLNNPKDIQDDTSVNANGNTEVSVASNGSTEQTDTAAVQEESACTEIQRSDEITCEELLNILQEKDTRIRKKVLIIDVRNEEEYCKSRMSFHNNVISIPAEKIQANKVPGYYRYILLYDIEAEKKFTRRSHYDIIALVDKNSELKTMDSDSKIAIFKHSLEEYDVHIDYKRIAVVKGGFEEWTNLYPNFVTKS